MNDCTRCGNSPVGHGGRSLLALHVGGSGGDHDGPVSAGRVPASLGRLRSLVRGTCGGAVSDSLIASRRTRLVVFWFCTLRGLCICCGRPARRRGPLAGVCGRCGGAERDWKPKR